VDRTREQLRQLGLMHAAEALAEELSEAVKHDRPPHVVLERLLSHEVSARDERRVRTSLKLSNLPVGLTLGNFDFGFQPSIERRQVETLATCAFIREHCTLLVQGPPGVGPRAAGGETHLVVALGVRAIEQRAPAGEQRGLLPAGGPAARDAQGRGGVAAGAAAEEVLQRGLPGGGRGGDGADGPGGRQPVFRLVSYRYRRGSTAITTNKSVKDWPGILAGDEAMTAALLDRLLHKSVVLNIRGRSYRLQELEKVLK
jgi:DNA replication protein DnaC